MKTDIVDNVGKHAFELAGLGLAPFRFVSASENRFTLPDGTSKPGGSCDYCGTAIANECWVLSADGKRFKVGCDCIRKVGDTGLLKAYKTNLEVRARQRAIRAEKAKAVFIELKSLIESHQDLLKSMPHPNGFTDRQTGLPLTAFDYATWMFSHCGATGRKAVLDHLRQMIG